MSDDLYYVIYNREDGASLREMTHDQLIHALNDEYFVRFMLQMRQMQIMYSIC